MPLISVSEFGPRIQPHRWHGIVDSSQRRRHEEHKLARHELLEVSVAHNSLVCGQPKVFTFRCNDCLCTYFRQCVVYCKSMADKRPEAIRQARSCQQCSYACDGGTTEALNHCVRLGSSRRRMLGENIFKLPTYSDQCTMCITSQ